MLSIFADISFVSATIAADASVFYRGTQSRSTVDEEPMIVCVRDFVGCFTHRQFFLCAIIFAVAVIVTFIVTVVVVVGGVGGGAVVVVLVVVDVVVAVVVVVVVVAVVVVVSFYLFRYDYC